MTQPDGAIPNGVYTSGAGPTGVKNIQSITEASAKESMTGGIKTKYNSIWDILIDTMFGGFVNGIIGFISSLVFGLKGVTGGLIDLTGFLTATENKANQATATANEAIENTTQVVQQVRAVMNSITAPFTESWMTQVPGQQVSFPDALLNTAPKRAGTSTASTNPYIGRFTVSTADSDGGDDWYTTYATAYTPAKDVLVAACIQSNYAVGRATFTVKVGPVTSPCDFYIVALRMLANGDDEVAWVSPNQTPLMSTGAAEWNVTAPVDIPYDELEEMVVGVHQIGTGNVRPIAAIERDRYIRSAESFPPQQAMNFSYASVMTPGSIIPKNSQQFSTSFLLWIAIGQRLYTGDPLPRQHVDYFDRTDLEWTRVGQAPAKIESGMFAHSSTLDLKSFHYFPQPLAYGDQRVEAFCSAPNGVEQGMMCRGNAAGSSFFALVLTSGGAALRQWTSASEDGYTTLGSYSGSTANTYWAIEAIGSVLTAYQLVDGVWILRVQVGGVGLLAGRYTGLFADRAFFANSGRWGSFSARDMVELVE